MIATPNGQDLDDQFGSKRDNLPQCTSGHVESSRVNKQLATFLCINLGQLSKSDVIANTHPNLTPWGWESGEVVARTEGIRFFESHLARNILTP